MDPGPWKHFRGNGFTLARKYFNYEPGGWQYFRDIDISNSLMARRTMLLVHRILHPSSFSKSQIPKSKDNLDHRFLSKRERLSVKLMLEETTNNQFLFDVMIWWSSHWELADISKVSKLTNETAAMITVWVRNPSIYKIEFKEAMDKWIKLRGDGWERVCTRGEEHWVGCKQTWKLLLKGNGMNHAGARLENLDIGFWPTYSACDWIYPDEGMDTEYDSDYRERQAKVEKLRKADELRGLKQEASMAAATKNAPLTRLTSHPKPSIFSRAKSPEAESEEDEEGVGGEEPDSDNENEAGDGDDTEEFQVPKTISMTSVEMVLRGRKPSQPKSTAAASERDSQGTEIAGLREELRPKRETSVTYSEIYADSDLEMENVEQNNSKMNDDKISLRKEHTSLDIPKQRGKTASKKNINSQRGPANTTSMSQPGESGHDNDIDSPNHESETARKRKRNAANSGVASDSDNPKAHSDSAPKSERRFVSKGVVEHDDEFPSDMNKTWNKLTQVVDYKRELRNKKQFD